MLRTLVRSNTERTAKILAAQFKRVGVELDIHAIYSDAEVIRALATERWDLAIAGIPDPMCHTYFIQSLLIFSQSPYSLTKDAQCDKLLIQMMQTLDEEKRKQIAQQLDTYVHDNALSLFTYQKIKTYGVRADVQFTPYLTGMPYFRTIERGEAQTQGAAAGDQHGSTSANTLQSEENASPAPR